MTTITQKMGFCQAVIHYAEKKGVTKAAIRYNVNRQYVTDGRNGTTERLNP